MDNVEERVVFSREVYNISRIEDIKVEFTLNDTTVYTKENQLIIESIKTIDSIDSSFEIKRYTRPDLLVIEGIMSYFTGHLFTIYDDRISDISQILENETNPSKKIESTIFLFEGCDYSIDVNLLLGKINENRYKTLIITLLDRWRKALFMVSESEVNTFHDEAILTHFHILELLVDNYYDEFKEEASIEIKSFLTRFSTETLNQNGNARENTISSKYNILKEVLISNEASITTKINYFLKRHTMFDDRTYTLINKIVKIRNSIAHGRTTYKDKLIWPLPPFFNITSGESQMIAAQIQVLTARAIAVHLDLNTWKDVWEDMHQSLPPSDEVIIRFIKNPNEHDQISGTALLEGSYENITVTSVVDYYIENRRKFSFPELELVLANTIKEVSINEDNCDRLFLASVLLCDAEDEQLSNISKRNVELVHKSGWYGYSNIKDIVRYFDFYGIEVKWLYSWILQKGHIDTKRG